MAYTRYVLEQGMSGDILDLRVAMLPCIAGYGEVAMAIKKEAENIGIHSNINTYSRRIKSL
jgi:thiaminase